jgi:hypothetical protein
MKTTTSPNRRSNFLGKLIDRATGTANVVTPRLPSLFEPVPWTAVNSGIDAYEESTLAETPAQRPSTTVAHTNDQAHADEIIHEISGSPKPIQIPPSARERASQINSSDTDVSAAVPSMTAVIETVRNVITEQTAPAPMPTLPSLHSTRDDISPTLRPQGEMRITDPQSSRIESEPAQIFAVQINDGPEPPPLRRVDQGVVAEPVAIPPIMHEPLATPTSEPIPTINVTIGRLEIRASQDSAAPKRHKPEPAGVRPMNLDDYLKQQWKGR